MAMVRDKKYYMYLGSYIRQIRFYFDMDGTSNEWDNNGDYTKPGYFENRPVYQNTIDCMHYLSAFGFSVAFGTSAYEGVAMEEKRRWADKVGCEDIPIIYIPYGRNKDNYLDGEIKILIDDHTPNCLNFSGIAVKFINEVNHKNGTWTGECIKYDMSGYEMAMKLMALALQEAERKASNIVN